MTGLLVASWAFLQWRERDTLDRSLAAAADRAAFRVEAFLGAHVDRLQQFSAQLAMPDALSEPSFREASLRYQQSHRGLQALNWVRADGLIEWVEPFESNQGAQGFDLTHHPVVGTILPTARAQPGVATATPPIRLLQGGWGMAIYIYVGAESGGLGYLNIVFRLRDVLDTALSRTSADDFTFLLRHEEDQLGALGPTFSGEGGLPTAEAPVRIAGQELFMIALAPSRLSAAGSTWVDECLLSVGIGIAGWLAWTLLLAQRQRRRSSHLAAKYRTVIDTAPDAIAILDARTRRFVDGNGRFSHWFDFDHEELTQNSPLDISPGAQPDGSASPDVFGRHLQAALSGEPAAFEWTFLDAEGGGLHALVRMVRLPPPQEHLILICLTDITKKLQLESQLRQAQAHEAMGRLAGAVAHDFNNLLTVIRGCSEVLETSVEGEDANLTADITKACDRASDLTRQLLAFSRKIDLDPKPIELSTLITEMGSILKRVVGARVRIRFLLDAFAWVRVDVRQFELAVLNLVVNARDAMPRGGTVAITTRELPDSRVELRVSDEGEGISSDVLDHIFKPFYTTKDPGVGTGIGLATVWQIVNHSNGSISAHSRPGEGATFRIVLPTVEPPASAPTPTQTFAPRASEDLAILLVEDDDDVRAILERSLRGAGHRVAAFPSAEDAIKAVADKTACDILITDFLLPGMTGAELEAMMRQDDPDLLSIIMTGFSGGEIDFGEESRRRKLRYKPLTHQDLLADIEALLQANASRANHGP